MYTFPLDLGLCFTQLLQRLKKRTKSLKRVSSQLYLYVMALYTPNFNLEVTVRCMLSGQETLLRNPALILIPGPFELSHGTALLVQDDQLLSFHD